MNVNVKEKTMTLPIERTNAVLNVERFLMGAQRGGGGSGDGGGGCGM